MALRTPVDYMLTCKDCGSRFDWRAHHTMAQSTTPQRCKPCKDARRAVHARKARLKKKYGMTPEEYEAILEEQDGTCAICRECPRDRPLFVDHCHRVGSRRGLLCNRCNTLLGYLENGGFDLLDSIQHYLSP